MSEPEKGKGESAGDVRDVHFRGGGFNPGRRPAAAWGGFGQQVGFWQAGSSLGWLSDIFLPSPAQIGVALWGLIESGDLWRHFSASLSRLFSGWLLGTLAGLSIGFAIGMFTLARSVGLSFVSALFPIPKIALLPLFIIWFGIGEPSKVATIFFGVFFPTVINTYSSVDNVSRSLIRMGQSFGLSTFAIVTKIVLPGSLPGIFAGFRISASIGIILLVAAEMIGAEYGIGALVLAAGNLMQTDLLLAGVVMLSLLGLSIGFVLTKAERWLLRWR
jgi:ABC-type nitrate/sulfonate/bicarbonate transport system permease component